MIIGTTPTHVFLTSVSLVDAVAIELTYMQGDILIAKTKEDCAVTATQVKTELTQEETFRFKPYGYDAEVQLTAKIMQGDKPKVLKSKVFKIDISKSLKKEAI